MMEIKYGGISAEIAAMRRRSESTERDVTAAVAEIISEVKDGGDSAVRGFCARFDRSVPERFELTRDEIESGAATASSEIKGALAAAKKNIAAFHELQLKSGFRREADGIVTGQIVRALDRVGIYVPGGTAAYPSTVLMNAVPAKVAGVRELIMVTPPSDSGGVDPDILAAAVIAGVDRVFCIGGAQAIAALAYGTETVPKVDKIVGPGNIYVATAKKLVYGEVDIDMIAGPSEILIVADGSASPVYAAADMLSQAEHDVLASAVLLTTSREVAEGTARELERQLSGLSREKTARASLENRGMILVADSIDECVDAANGIAPEHMELLVADPEKWLGKVRNAGSVFLGAYSPEPLGDYYAGPNHVLPTSGTARFFSPLSVDSFVKRMQYIQCSREALAAASGDIAAIARREGLTAHANAVLIRGDGNV